MKKFLCGLLSAALAVSLTVPMAGAAYTDVPSESTLGGEVEKAVRYGLMNGYSDTTFGYGDSMTRAQFAAVLVRMMGWETVTPATADFTDVPVSHTWYGAVETAAAHDVVDEGGAFRPGDAITRGEMSEMLVRALGLKSTAEMVETSWTDRRSAWYFASPFSDVSGDQSSYIAVAYTIGMTNGTSDHTFSPDATATRAQAAAMLVRIYEKLHQETDFTHGFYAISSYSQLDLVRQMDAVSAGWSRMTWDGTAALLSTTNANGNEYAVPSGYEEVADTVTSAGGTLNLSVYMDTSDGVKDLLASADGRSQAVDQIVNELTVTYKTLGRNPYDGVTIDFEGLRSEQRADFTAFLTELADAVHGMDKTLYVCVSPVLLSGSYYDGYDYGAIGALADKVILMAYDYEARDMSAFVGTEYYKTAATVPLDQVYLGLSALKAQGVTADKIVLGLSCKNVAWKIDGEGKMVSGAPVTVSNETLHQRLAQSDTVKGWSDTYQQSYAVYTTEDGSRYFVWYQDDESITRELETAKLLGISGVSLWRLGTIPAYSDWFWISAL
ncbi:MAG: S-layer homology domain-containing protein [Dysosmobacter sp.]|uniref:S-layer homology domain-containing protein n=1 Tax=Dysosmobacter sp. TaxID=2591382 RepID=UPI0028461928|nr:S-layer homology domain-containing protein [Dysosmobacter sp.]MDR3982396.1 S-layer homology domain-containing protein [Dysosmobacter sp.]